MVVENRTGAAGNIGMEMGARAAPDGYTLTSAPVGNLAIASLKRSPVLPTVPTIAEAGGLPGFQAVSWYALVGPAGMPPAVVAKIQADAARVIQLPEIRERLQGLGAEPVGSTPAELGAAIKADYDRYGTVIKRLGIKAD